jgi:uncharacterized protein YxjI
MLGMRYVIRERAIAARDVYCVADESGRDILRVDGEGQHTFALKDLDGAPVTTIRRQLTVALCLDRIHRDEAARRLG